MTKNELIAFEEEIKDLFLEARIRAPIHLSRGNEEQLIKIFKEVKPEDWVFSTHRSHYHALLKGIDPEWVRDEILSGRSMHLNNKEHNFFSSAIVSGCLPIALGAAMAIKRKRVKKQVWVFVGDMARETGIFHECFLYALLHQLPITFVVEDNGLSTNTPTHKVWGRWKHHTTKPPGPIDNMFGNTRLICYEYKRGFPHINVGKFVEFK